MPRDRGAANLQAFNDNRSRPNPSLIEQELKRCCKHQLSFRTPGLLAAYVAERTGIHRTTLLRNPNYRALLFAYLATQSGAVAAWAELGDDPTALRASLALAQAQIGNLRQELKRAMVLLERTGGDSSIEGSKQLDLANIAATLCLVLERVETIAVDTKSLTLVDLAARPTQRVVAESDRASAFIRWLDENSLFPAAKKIARVRDHN